MDNKVIENRRRLVALAHSEGLSVSEISNALNLKRKAVQAMLPCKNKEKIASNRKNVEISLTVELGGYNG